MQSIASSPVGQLPQGNLSNDEYALYLANINARFVRNSNENPVFTTDVDGLWEAYLEGFTDPVDRQYHNCNCCRHFIECFGALVTIDAKGRTQSAIWHLEDTPEHYSKAVTNMLHLIAKAKVTGVFYTDHDVLGSPETGVWSHFHLKHLKAVRNISKVDTAYEKMAEKKEDFRIMITALSEFSHQIVGTALTLLEAEALYRSEKVTGPVKFLRDVHKARAEAYGSAKANVLWRAVALAPAGFCHPRSGMSGTLLEDLKAGLDFPTVAKRFADKMQPHKYQRPVAPPSAGNIKAGEELIAKLGLAKSLERRFARLEEVQALWRPPVKQVEALKSDGVFAHLKPKDAKGEAPALKIPPTKMTFTKFMETVAPKASALRAYVSGGRQNFGATVTAVHPDAPPILQWDRPEQRNPASWYVYTTGSPASQWGLKPNTFVDVTAISLVPSHWNGDPSNHAKAVMFILKGAADTLDAGNALFPEILISELHGIRATIEAYSKSAPMSGREEASACGIVASASNEEWTIHLQADVDGQQFEYLLDRWS